jgi:hypothetical protein
MQADQWFDQLRLLNEENTMGSKAQILAASLLSGVLLTTVTPEVEASPRYAVGWCQVARKDLTDSLSPISIAKNYIYQYQRNNPKFKSLDLAEFRKNAKVSFLSQPKLGVVVRTEYGWLYQATKLNEDGTYVGTDRFVVKVESKGISIFVHYYIEVIGNDPPTYMEGNERYDHFCKRSIWKISSNTPGITDPATLAQWQSSGDLMNLLADAGQVFTGFSPRRAQ